MLQSGFLFGIGVSFTSISRMSPPGSGMKRLDMLGVDILMGEVLGVVGCSG